MSRIWWHRFRSRVLWFRSALSHRGRALRYRPALWTQRSLLLPHHRPERTLGLMGLRIHRSSSLPLPLTRLNPKAPAIIALQIGQLSRPEQVIAQYGARKSAFSRIMLGSFRGAISYVRQRNRLLLIRALSVFCPRIRNAYVIKTYSPIL